MHWKLTYSSTSLRTYSWISLIFTYTKTSQSHSPFTNNRVKFLARARGHVGCWVSEGWQVGCHITAGELRYGYEFRNWPWGRSNCCSDCMAWWRNQMETFSALLAICAGIHRSPVNSPRKGQRRGALMFSLICVWINSWVNNREAGDLRRCRAHYDVTVMDHSISTNPPKCKVTSEVANHSGWLSQMGVGVELLSPLEKYIWNIINSDVPFAKVLATHIRPPHCGRGFSFGWLVEICTWYPLDKRRTVQSKQN